MFYAKIHDTAVQLNSFTMYYYYVDITKPYLEAQIASEQDLQTLDQVLASLYTTPQQGLSIYSDAELTNLIWSNNNQFKIETLTESTLDDGKTNKYIKLSVC